MVLAKLCWFALPVVIGLVGFIYYRYRSRFWSGQPAMQYSDRRQEGYIKRLSSLSPPSLPPELKWTQPTHQELQAFLEAHFIPYTLQVLQKFPHDFLFGLTRQGQLVGTIAGRPSVINLAKVEDLGAHKAMLVDHLCLIPEERNNGLAPLLIGKMAYEMGQAGFEMAFFHKDDTLLPISPVASFHYYGRSPAKTEKAYDNPKFSFQREEMSSEVSQFIEQQLAKFSLYTQPEGEEVWVLRNNKQMVGAGRRPSTVVGVSMVSRERPGYVKIDYHLSEPSVETVHDYYINSVLADQNIYLVSLAPHRSLIRTAQLTKIRPTHLYLYNYRLHLPAEQILV